MLMINGENLRTKLPWQCSLVAMTEPSDQTGGPSGTVGESLALCPYWQAQQAEAQAPSTGDDEPAMSAAAAAAREEDLIKARSRRWVRGTHASGCWG